MSRERDRDRDRSDKDRDRSDRGDRDRSDRDDRDSRGRGRLAADGRKVFIGNLSSRTDERDVEDCFDRYGRIRSIFMSRSGFAFVEFEDRRDAEDAVRDMDGREFRGSRIRVELARDDVRRERPSVSDTKCFNCNQFGHFAADCPKPTNRGECYICGKMGHRYADCPERGGKPRERSRERDRGRDRSKSPAKKSSHSHSRSRSPAKESSSHRSKSPAPASPKNNDK